MSFIPNFSVSQNLATPSYLTFTDTSKGLDVLVTNRKISIQKSDGTFLLNNYNWSIGQNTIEIDVLDRDYGLSVSVDYVNISGVVLHTKNYKLVFVAYTTLFLMELTQQEVGATAIRYSKYYWISKSKLQLLLDNAKNAVVMGNDYKKAQTFLNYCYNIYTNKNKYFQ